MITPLKQQILEAYKGVADPVNEYGSITLPRTYEDEDLDKVLDAYPHIKRSKYKLVSASTLSEGDEIFVTVTIKSISLHRAMIARLDEVYHDYDVSEVVIEAEDVSIRLDFKDQVFVLQR